MMGNIKLTNILLELQVANPNISVEKVQNYYINNILNNYEEFAGNSPGWKEYEQIYKPYLRKYNIHGHLGYYKFKKLSKPDLIKFYKEIRALVRKYVGKEILNELQVANPGITAENVNNYYLKNIYNNNKEFGKFSEGWKEYKQICKPYVKKYNIVDNHVIHYIHEFKKLSKSELIQFYNEMRALVQKYK